MRNKNIVAVIIVAVALILFILLNKKENTTGKQVSIQTTVWNNNTLDIRHLTDENIVIPYVKRYHHLPDCYITKREAREQGWNPAHGNICDVLPGRAIGGDRFINRGHSLPDIPGRKWFEADINFDCGRRNAGRLLFSSDGLVYVTKDHYRTFIRQ